MKRSAKKLIIGLLACMMALSSIPMAVLPAQAGTAPSDLEGHWAKSAVMQWVAKDLGSGYPDGTFKPNKPVTRAEFAIMANKAFGVTSGGNAAFTDCKSTDWYYSDLAAAFNKGYISGYAGGSVMPSKAITRQEAAVMLAKLLNLPTGGAAQFTDSAQLPAWAAGSAAAIANAGAMKGYPDGSFKGSNAISRAEAVVALLQASSAAGNILASTPSSSSISTSPSSISTSAIELATAGSISGGGGGGGTVVSTTTSSAVKALSVSIESIRALGNPLKLTGGLYTIPAAATKDNTEINVKIANTSDVDYTAEIAITNSAGAEVAHATATGIKQSYLDTVNGHGPFKFSSLGIGLDMMGGSGGSVSGSIQKSDGTEEQFDGDAFSSIIDDMFTRMGSGIYRFTLTLTPAGGSSCSRSFNITKG